MFILLPLALTLAAQLETPPRPAPPPQVNPCDSLIIEQARAALAALASAELAHTDPARPLTTAIYEGTVSTEAHLMRPGMLRTVPVRMELAFDPRLPGFSLSETSGPPDAAHTETNLYRRGRVADQASGSAPFKERAPAIATSFLPDASRWLPAALVHAARAAASSCRPGAPVPRDGQTLSPITFADTAGSACTLLLDQDHRVCRVESLTAHPRLGDICEWTHFSEWKTADGVATPGHISRFMVVASVTMRYELALVSSASGPSSEAPFALPLTHQSDLPDWDQPSPTSTSPPTEFTQLAPGLWTIDLAAPNARVMLIERSSDLVLLGTPDSDAVCAVLLDVLRTRFPGKPIGTAAFSHHHPSPSGGLRAIAATGASIVTPRALEPFARTVLSRPTSLGPPAQPGPQTIRFELFENETTLDCGENSVRLIDIAEHSAHAFSYIVFYFPSRGILFEDDLGYFPAEGAARPSPRLAGLVEALTALHVEPNQLIQAWPVRGTRRVVDWTDVVTLAGAHSPAGR